MKNNNNSEELLNEKYLPFTKEDFLKHFANVKEDNCSNSKEKHLKDYISSVDNYNKYLESKHKEKSLDKLRKPRQIEKDERFWTASSLMTLFYSANMVKEFTNLFSKAYGDKPPINIDSWEDCFSGEPNKNLHLFFEANLPSPVSYKDWLKHNITERQFIPYILDCAMNTNNEFRDNLEGPTNVDAILINSKNGFSVIIEAKVLSDISINITYDSMRNQLARNIDVMLERNDNLCEPLKSREPEKTLFLLITPELFRKNPKSRLYGYKFNEYKSSPSLLSDDMPHRSKENFDWTQITKRLGWLSWEEFKEVNQECCLWLDCK